jgi:membrane-associated phospholipid phosphatase
MKKRLLMMGAAVLLLNITIYGQETVIPVSKAFHNIGPNMVHSFTYNYGANFFAAAAGSYGLIRTGIDWQVNRLAYNNAALAYAGLPSLYIGYIVPLVAPLAFYITGRSLMDGRLQVTGLALAQTAIISTGFSSLVKGITGRIPPGIIDTADHHRSDQTTDYSGDFAWGFGKRGFIAGYPSAHAANAFAAAAALSEIYHDNPAIKSAAYIYASFIGLGVSLCVHWSSEVFAGALIGYAIGKTVGKSFNQLLEDGKKETISLFVSFNTLGITIQL